MGTLEELLQNPIYRHLVLNHVPVIGLLVAWIVLLVGAVLRERGIALLGLVLVAATAGSALLVMLAGEEAYPVVYDALDGLERERLDRHADLAGLWGLSLYLTAGLSVLGAGLALLRPALTADVSRVVAAVALGSLLAAFVIADAGGRIRHPHGASGGPVAQHAVGGEVSMRRLNRSQYRQAVAEVFGGDVELGPLEPDTRRDGLLAVGSAQMAIGASALERYEALAGSVAQQVLAESRRDALLSCRPASPTGPDDDCTEAFVRETGERLFRRTLGEQELAARVGAARLVSMERSDFYAGLHVALTSLLTSPDFLFRIERTRVGADGSDRMQLTDETLAARLSYLVWDAAPDEGLRGAAARGELGEPRALAEHVDRLLASPRARDGVRSFFSDVLRLDEIDDMSKDLARYPFYDTQLAEDAREQTLRVVVDHLIDQEGDYRDLFTTRRSFLTRELGPIYRVPVRSETGWEAFEFPEGDPYTGILSHASLNMLHAHPGRSSPTLRGQFLRESVLCQTVPPAPADVEFALFNDDQNPDHKTARDRLEVHSSNASCRSCHRLTDPIGLGLERFDGIGQYRDVENGAPIDPSGDLDGTSFGDVPELGEAFRGHPALVPCLVQTLYRYAVGRDPVPAEHETLGELEQRFADSGYRFPALVRALALSETFRTASPADDLPMEGDA